MVSIQFLNKLTHTTRLILFALLLIEGEILAEKKPDSDRDLNYEANIVPTKVSSCKIDNAVTASADIVASNNAELRTGWTAVIDKINVSVGTKVKKGEVIATVDKKDIKQQKEMYEDYRSLYVTQLKIYNTEIKSLTDRKKRLTSLVTKGIIPETDLETLDKSLISIVATQTQVERNIAAVDAQVQDLGSQIKNANFYSPIDGVITQLIADPNSISGQLVATNSALVARVEQPGTYLAKGSFLDTQVAKIKIGLLAEVTLPSGAKYPGKIRFISPLAFESAPSDQNQEGNNEGNKKKLSKYTVEVEFERTGDMLPQGLLGTITIDLGDAQASQCVPWNAILTRDKISSLSIYSQELGWQMKEVALGRRGQYYVEILTPLPKNSIVNSTIW